MRQTIFDRFWHQTLRRPYQLTRSVDINGRAPVVLLHGLGASSQVWRYVIKLLEPHGRRIVAFDLLGFGASPKPQWLDYDVDDHARAVIASIARLRLGEPVVLAGHSMGCLVAVRVARLRPDLVHHLVLYEMPLYEGLPEKRRYRLRINFYLRLYQRIINYQPSFSPAEARLIKRLTQRITGFRVDRETWTPFVRSLERVIVRQTTAQDIKQLTMPMDVIYGSFDMLVIRGQPQQFFGDKSEQITAHTVRARHVISFKASQFIVQRIEAALA